MEETGTLYAEAKGQSWQMQELKGSVLASIINKTGESVMSRAEIIAKSSEEYQAYVKETAEVIKTELKLKCEYEKWKCSFEALRSLSSLEKVTQNLSD